MNVGIGRQTLTRLVVFGVFAATLAAVSVPAQPARAAEDACPLTEGIVLNANGETWGTDHIRSDRDEVNAIRGPVAVSIPAGRYSIMLATYDEHTNNPIFQGPQLNERWFLEGWNGDTLVFKSGTTADLPEDRNSQVELVNADIEIGAVTKLVVRHGGFPDTSSPNSLFPQCASFQPSLTNPPPDSPTNIIVLGGTAAVSDSVATALESCVAGPVARIAGTDRYATAAAVSKAFFDSGVSTVYIATGENFPDALSGSAAAGVGTGGPILLVQTDSIPASTRTELARLRPNEIVILGGTAAVTRRVEDLLKAYGSVVRVAGRDRFETSALTSARTFGAADTLYIATGRNFPDALAGGPAAIQAGGPVLLVEQNSIPGSVKIELARLSPASIRVLGGNAAVSAKVVSDLRSVAADVSRIDGPNRYGTAAAISEATFDSAGIIFIATGENFPDALAAGPVAGAAAGPILLVSQDRVPSETRAEIARLTGLPCSP